MATLNIQGKKVTVDDSFLSLTPEQQNATVDEIAGQIGIQPEAPESDMSQKLRSDLSGITQSLSKDKGDSSFRNVDSFMRGAADVASFGMADELAALGNATVDAITGTPNQYERRLQQERITQKIRDNNDPIASTAGRVAGGVASAGGLIKNGVSLVGRLAPEAGLLAKTAASAGEGAAYGGAYGFGSGEGLEDRIKESAGGAVAGAVIGGALPPLFAGTKAVTKPITDAIGARINPGAYADRKVAERLASSNLTPATIANKMENAPGATIADLAGKDAKNLLRTAVNIPGPARDRVNKQLILRQFGQGDRLKTAIGKTFADPDGYLSAKDELSEAAKTIAAPLYKRAYEQPVHYSEALESILNTNAGKAALRKAEELASNEQVPFQQLFVNVADNGAATAKRVPDTRAWDYIKRAMDDQIDAQTDSITKKVTNEGRILVGLKNRMLSEVDRLNPDYKAARQAFGGVAQIDEALEFGRGALSMSTEAVKRQMSMMTAAQKEAARIGAAEDLRKAIDAAGYTNNAVLKIFNNRQRYGNLQALFDNQEKFSEFRKTIFNEARKRSTYDTVRGNSTTAAQMADMAEAGGLKDATSFAATSVTSGPVTATLQYVGNSLRRLGGLTPEVADEISKRLMSSSPDTTRKFVGELLKIEAMQVAKEEKTRLIQSLVSKLLTVPSVEASRQTR